MIASDKSEFVKRVKLWIEDELKPSEENVKLDDMMPIIEDNFSNTHNSVFNLHASFISEFQEQQPTKNASLTREIAEFLTEKCCHLNYDPLLYWKVSKTMQH
jgi:hypothetical protein